MMNFEIGAIHKNTPYLFSDLAELLLLTSKNRHFLHQNDLESLFDKQDIAPDDFDDEIEEDASTKTSAERNSKQDRQIDDVMFHLKYREGAFGSFYPFEVQGDRLVLKEPLNEKQKIYRLLLACSRLRSFSKKSGIIQKWARSFTFVTKFAAKALAPKAAHTHIFDAGSQDRATHYHTNYREAAKILGNNLGVLNFNESEINKAKSSGDGGIDLVSFLPFNDGASSHYAILGQSGAQEKEWPQKTLEASPVKLRHLFQMQFDYPNTMFIPVCYRSSSGEWFDNKSVNGVLLIDRLRIIKLLDEEATSSIVTEPWFLEFEKDFLQYQYDDF